MANHVGSNCFYCDKEFTEQDDVVVCPECGTPYHRECWKKAGKCTNEALHETGGKWQTMPTLDEIIPFRCPNCGTENARDAVRCKNCGAALHHEEENTNFDENRTEDTNQSQGSWTDRTRNRILMSDGDDPFDGHDKSEDMDGVPVGDVGDFVGSNLRYYIPKFLRFRGTNKRITINFPCLFFPHLWFAYRKMWLGALIICVLYAIFQLPQMALSVAAELSTIIESLGEDSSGNVDMLVKISDTILLHEGFWNILATIGSYLDLCIGVVMCFLGNWIYYRYSLRSVRKVRAKNFSEAIQRVTLQSNGGTNFWFVVLFIVVEYVSIFLAMLILFVICIL